MSSTEPQVYLIRHGEATNNMQTNTICGQALEAPLTSNGVEQASSLGSKLRRIGLIPDVIYTSTATRALDTGAHTLRGMGIDYNPVEDSRLLEQHTGDWTGRIATDVFTDKQVKEIERLGKDFRAPNGESMNDVGERMFNWLGEVEEYDDGIVFAFTHGGAIRALASFIDGWDHERTYNTRPEHVSLSLFKKKAQLWVPEYVGAMPSKLESEMIIPTELSNNLSENETVRGHLRSVLWFGSRKNNQDVHDKSDFDIQIVLDDPSVNLTLELNKILRNYPDIDLSIMYTKDIVDENGQIIFHDGTKGLFFMQVLAEGKVLYGSNIYSELVNDLDAESIKPSLIVTIREYLSRLRVMAAHSNEDTQEFKKYSLKILKDMLLYDGVVELKHLSKLDNDTTISKASNQYSMSPEAQEALQIAPDYDNLFSQSQMAVLLIEFEEIVRRMCNE